MVEFLLYIVPGHLLIGSSRAAGTALPGCLVQSIKDISSSLYLDRLSASLRRCRYNCALIAPREERALSQCVVLCLHLRRQVDLAITLIDAIRVLTDSSPARALLGL